MIQAFKLQYVNVYAIFLLLFVLPQAVEQANK